MREIVLIAHNLRSCHNVGSLLRTAEGLGITKLYLTGYTPYPIHDGDTRMPHLSAKIAKQIHKTALGAEDMVPWNHQDDVSAVLAELKASGYTVAAVEQATHSIQLPAYAPPDKVALLVGREVEGVEPGVLAACDAILEIPMFGEKESFNVVQAAAITMYHCRFLDPHSLFTN
jgi:23S rRNA (guanosine2251-2'-O)-methyltransferase